MSLMEVPTFIYIALVLPFAGLSIFQIKAIKDLNVLEIARPQLLVEAKSSSTEIGSQILLLVNYKSRLILYF